MFSKALVASTLAVFVAAAATGQGHDGNGPVSQCNVGTLQCCNNIQPASAGPAQALIGLLGIVLQNANVPIGVACNPISVIGVGAGSNCAAQPACCEDNNYNGVVAVGCTPVNVGA